MRILFVCLGNICRSPSGENMLRAIAKREGIADQLEIDSAGTADYNIGNPPDARMTKSANRRGIEMKGRARQVKSSDFSGFDLILAMDLDNMHDLETWQKSSDADAKLVMFCDFCEEHPNVHEVPDPYYGGAEGFEDVMDLLEDGCSVIARKIKDGTLLD